MIPLFQYQSVDSTNEEAKRLLPREQDGDFVVLATTQEQGKGRTGKRWHSPEGNLYLTLAIRNQKRTSPAMTPWSFLAALALEDAIAPLMHDLLSFKFKWPNDVLIDGKKSAGILVERLHHQARLGVGSPQVTILIGLGVNVFTLPQVEEYPTTALACHAVLERDAVKMLATAWLAHLETWFQRYEHRGFLPVQEAWMKRSWLSSGDSLSLEQTGKILTGTFRGIANNGALCLEAHEGGVQFITAGGVL